MTVASGAMQVTQIENVGTLAGRHSGVNSNQFLRWCGVGVGFGLLKLLWKMVVSAVGDASGWPWFNARHDKASGISLET
jgi:hypothetical protein